MLDILRKAPGKLELLKLLADIDDKWYYIGLELNVPQSTLDGLKTNPEKNMYKLEQVIETWINTTDENLVTWAIVLTAIEGSIINNRKKASEIRQFLMEGMYMYAMEFTIIINY